MALDHQTENLEKFQEFCHSMEIPITLKQIDLKPEELPVYDPNWESGVNGITADDLDITIENGNIIAPQGTRVFNMSGMETGTENLAPGIYIVRVGSKALKVVVR